MEGYLLKRKAKGKLSRWLNRYCVIYRSSALSYYSSKEDYVKDNSPVGIIPLKRGMTVVIPEHKPHKFTLTTEKGQAYQFKTPNPEECKEWVQHLSVIVGVSGAAGKGANISSIVHRRKSRAFIMRDYMTKGSTRLTKKKYWFILRPRHLEFFKSEKEEEIAGSLDLENAVLDVPAKQGFVFTLTAKKLRTAAVAARRRSSFSFTSSSTSTKTYTLTVNSLDERNAWMNAIQTNISLMRGDKEMCEEMDEKRRIVDATRRFSISSSSSGFAESPTSTSRSGSHRWSTVEGVDKTEGGEGADGDDDDDDAGPPPLPSRGADYERRLSLVNERRKSVMEMQRQKDKGDDGGEHVALRSEISDPDNDEEASRRNYFIKHDADAPPSFSMSLSARSSEYEANRAESNEKEGDTKYLASPPGLDFVNVDASGVLKRDEEQGPDGGRLRDEAVK
eukprot:g36.t1